MDNLNNKTKETTSRTAFSESIQRVKELIEEYDNTFSPSQNVKSYSTVNNTSKGIKVPYENEFIFSTVSSNYKTWQKNEFDKHTKKKYAKDIQSLLSSFVTTQLHNLKENDRTVVIMDVDDVILNSLETVINIINEDLKEELLSTEDVKTWDFQAILRKIAKSNNPNKYLYTTTKDIVHIFDEDSRFRDRVTIKEGWRDFFADKDIQKKISILFFTQGTFNSNDFKQDYLRRELGFEFTQPLELKETPKSQMPCSFLGVNSSQRKIDYLQDLDLKGIVQVEDNYNNLKNSQCTFKILLTNDRKTDFNQVAVNDENTYIANTVEEVIEMLRFVSENEEFLDNKSSENNENYLF